ncbi:hypothetical protein [uncultured Fibrella sp.]|uniref:hypothetical protein n=1 Tax=uncultured Fibrella sp. TaxID=1284596 RepID=UPI0035CB14EF
MELSDDLLEQIGAYLSGQLADEEKARFDARLRQEPELRQEVALQRELKQGLSFLAQKNRFKQLHADLDKRGLLTETDKQVSQPERTQPPVGAPAVGSLPQQHQPGGNLFRYGRASWVMAASLALLLGIGWVVYSNRTEQRQEMAQNDAAFTRFFSPDPKPVPPLPPDPDRVAAPLENSRAAPDSMRLQMAINGLTQPDLQPVITELTALSIRKPGHWSASAQWYLALAYLKTNQRTQARPLLEKIAGLNGHPYQQEARLLLSQLPLSSAR